MQPDGDATFLAHHFPDAPTQEHAARLGMWLFLATEILLFTALFTAYALYRHLFPETFHAASEYIETRVGLTNTVVLITSSLTVALALHASRQGQGKRAAALLVLTLAFGGVFMVLKGFEYHHHFVTGQLPGRYYAFAELTAPGAAMFFTVYFLMTSKPAPAEPAAGRAKAPAKAKPAKKEAAKPKPAAKKPASPKTRKATKE